MTGWVGGRVNVLANVAGVTHLGGNGDANNATYFAGDKVHLLDAGYALWEPVTTAAINSL